MSFVAIIVYNDRVIQTMTFCNHFAASLATHMFVTARFQ